MFTRSIQAIFEEQMRQYPVVTITGPRQSGKTTLVKTQYPERPYYNLENPDVRMMIESDPRQFMDSVSLQKGVIIDEVQKLPVLLSYIQTRVDEQRVPGSFLLTGSHQLQLSEAISQSLAGRTALLELLPLSLIELRQQITLNSIDEYLLQGFFPAIYQYNMDAVTHARNYIKTYVERDVRQLINIKDLSCFQRFLKLCAGRLGSLINRDELGAEVGISHNTVKHWLSLLDSSYITFQLKPYFENFGKRQIKTSKLYFTDVGLASYLLEIRSTDQMQIDKMRGHLFENFVILEMMKNRYNAGKDADLYFYRDSHHNEVDVVASWQGRLIPIEIKSTMTFNPALLKNVQYFQALAGYRAPLGYLIYNGDLEPRIGSVQVLNFKNTHRVFSDSP